MRRGLLRALHLVLMGALFLSFLQTSCVLAEEALDDEQSELSRMIQELTGFYYEDDAIQMTIQQRCDLADAAMEEPVVPSTKLKKYKYLYVGASRTNRIRKGVKDSKTYFEAAPGAGSRWFGMERDGKQACLLTIRSYLDARPDGNVIIELGNNDVCNMDVYMHVYKRLIEAYPNAKIWFVDVLPGSGSSVDGEKKNQYRQIFNDRLHQEFPDRCLGGYSYILQNSKFKTKDGTHYPTCVARKFYKYVMKKLGRNIRYQGMNVVDG